MAPPAETAAPIKYNYFLEFVGPDKFPVRAFGAMRIGLYLRLKGRGNPDL